MITPQDVNLLRDAAVLLERDHLAMAERLMEMAHRARPDGPFIKAKLEEYRARRSGPEEKARARLQGLVQSGALAIVPAGFRCHTKTRLAEAVGLRQASLPFDSGFFPPASIARLLETRHVALDFPDPDQITHRICTKHEDVRRGDRRGILFRSSSYAEIDAQAQARDQPRINSLLDAGFAYYTLDRRHGFVLAHYNWHRFASDRHSKGICDPAVNIPGINRMLTMRLARMIEMCSRAQSVLFVLGEFQNFDFMAVEDEIHELDDLDPIRAAVEGSFGPRAQVLRFAEIDTAEKLLARIG